MVAPRETYRCIDRNLNDHQRSEIDLACAIIEALFKNLVFLRVFSHRAEKTSR